ncbi:hypothetical protein ACHAW5_007364 [Stephanodiscus triporus]|uniref:RRM domain-containing protein n=1 Tax=Stephanodiscus triporus TaxID=2934178 RepID=A0ABD3P549_9STRA
MDDNDDATPVAPAPQDPNPNSGGDDYDKGEGGGENNGGAMGGDGVGAPSTFAAMAGTMTTDSVVVQQPGGTLSSNGGGGGDDEEGAVGGGGGNLYLRPIFFGNLSHDCLATDVEKLFLNPPPPPTGGGGMDEGTGEVRAPFDLERVDMKRGFCFVFLKDPPTIEEKSRCEDFVEEINGMYV